MRFRKALFGVFSLALAGLLWSAPPRTTYVPPEVDRSAPPVPLTLKTPSDAVSLALQDLQTVPPFDRCYTRYLFVQNASQTAMRVSSLALNYISRGSVIMRPIPVQKGFLLRLDLRWYAARDADLAEWVKLWEEFAFDPMFALLVTKDSLEFAAKAAEQSHEVVVEPIQTRTESRTVVHPGGEYVYPDDSGRRHANLPAGNYTVDLEFRQVVPTKRQLKPVDVLRFNAPHLPQEQFLQLQTLTVTTAPIVEYRYFLSRALSTIQDKGVFKQVFGGLYYQLRGIKKSNVKGASDLDLFFESLGIGNIKAGLKQEQLFDQLRSDQRLAIFRSDITGKPREVSIFHSLAEREGASEGSITGDIKDERIDVGDRSFANLLNPRRDAREAIFPGRLGFPIYALFNADGVLQDEVPPDIAVDNTIPSPYTKRLQPAIGCLRCHGPNDGWKPLVNDVKTLTQGRLDIFGDLSQNRKAFSPDTIDRLAGLYAGNFDKFLRRARDDAAEAHLRASGPWKESADQADAGQLGASRISAAYADYNYALIDAQKALAEMGIDAAKDKAAEIYNKITAIEPDPPASIYLEDPRIAAIGRGIPVLRADFALIYAELMNRASLKRSRLTGPVQPVTPNKPLTTTP